MNKAELKKLIKTLVKECVKETLLEEGVLSGIVSEVVKGVSTAQPITEHKKSKPKTKVEPDYSKLVNTKKKINEHQKKLLDAIGVDAYNGVDLFEGTTPAPAEHSQAAGTVDLGAPNDSGVDISSLVGGASQIWNAMK